MRIADVLPLNRSDFRFPFHDEGQCRGEDAAHIQRMVVEQGEQAGGVDAHQPVGLGPAEGGLVQAVIVAAVF